MSEAEFEIEKRTRKQLWDEIQRIMGIERLKGKRLKEVVEDRDERVLRIRKLESMVRELERQVDDLTEKKHDLSMENRIREGRLEELRYVVRHLGGNKAWG